MSDPVAPPSRTEDPCARAEAGPVRTAGRTASRRRAVGRGDERPLRRTTQPQAADDDAAVGRAAARGRVEVAVLDRSGVIVAVNPAWSTFARDNDGEPARTGVGTSYLAVCDTADEPEAAQVAAAIRAAVAGDLPAPFTLRMPCDSPTERRTLDVVVTSRLADDGSSVGATVAVTPVAEAPRTVPDPDGADGPWPQPALVRAVDSLRGAFGAAAAAFALQPATAERVVEVGTLPARPVSRQLRLPLGDDRTGQLCLHFASAQDARRLDVVAAPVALAGTTVALALRLDESERLQQRVDWAVRVLERVLDEDAPRGPDVARGHVTEDIATAFDADGGVLLVIREDRDTAQVRAATGVLAGDLGRTLTRVPDAVAQARDTGGPVADAGGRAGLGHGGTALWVPLGASSSAACVLGLLRSDGRPFTPAETAAAASLGRTAARVLALDAARTARERTLLREDRDRIAADLHDHVVQQLFAVGHGLDLVAARSDDAALRSRLGSFVSALDASVRRIRDSIHRLHSDDRESGLRQRVIAVLDEELVALGFAAHAEFEGPVDTAADATLADDVVAVVREALSNVARHARATHADVRVTHRDGVLSVEVVDNGVGARGPRPGGHGLGNLHLRARNHDGRVELTHPPGGGTRLLWSARTRRL